jgi:hypothetical protein
LSGRVKARDFRIADVPVKGLPVHVRQNGRSESDRAAEKSPGKGNGNGGGQPARAEHFAELNVRTVLCASCDDIAALEKAVAAKDIRCGHVAEAVDAAL